MVKAKPLSWVESPRHGKRVHTARDYEIIERYPSGAAQYCVLYQGLPRCFVNDYPTLEAAKAAAQADYEKRILACLEDTPADPWLPVETEGGDVDIKPYQDLIGGMFVAGRLQAATDKAVADVIRRLDEIAELNRLPPDENGHRWDRSDLIAQTIMLAKNEILALIPPTQENDDE